MILRGATSLQGALEGVGPENRDLNPYINNKTVIKILLARQFEAVSNIVKMMKLLSWRLSYLLRQTKYFDYKVSLDGTIETTHTVKKNVSEFPALSRDVTNQTLPGRERMNYSRPGRVWLVLGTGKSLTFFTVYNPSLFVMRQNLFDVNFIVVELSHNHLHVWYGVHVNINTMRNSQDCASRNLLRYAHRLYRVLDC